MSRKLLWAYLMAPIYAPEDRQQFINTVVAMIFRENNFKITMLVRIYEHDGTSKLCLESLLTFQEAGMHGLIFKTESKCEGREGRKDGGKRFLTIKGRDGRRAVCVYIYMCQFLHLFVSVSCARH
jgi:hypothetical protein